MKAFYLLRIKRQEQVLLEQLEKSRFQRIFISKDFRLNLRSPFSLFLLLLLEPSVVVVLALKIQRLYGIHTRTRSDPYLLRQERGRTPRDLTDGTFEIRKANVEDTLIIAYRHQKRIWPSGNTFMTNYCICLSGK
ncbi:hypothetical protein LguiA_002890 [Lonicera macranthoides]